MEQITKKLLYQKSKHLIDPETGELVLIEQSCKMDGDFNFHKVWLKNFTDSCGGILTGKVKLLFFLLEQAQKKTNRICLTQLEISQKSKVSVRTVSATLNELKQSGFLKMEPKYILINPDIIFKGSYNDRVKALKEWNEGRTAE